MVAITGKEILSPNQLRELHNPKEEGAWFVFAYDDSVYPIGLHKEEIDALRHVSTLGYGYAVFWPFGKDWDDIKP